MRLLLTGFTPFGRLAINPSEVVVKEIARRAKSWGFDQIVVEILRTEFAEAEDRICELIQQLRPDAVVLLGVAVGESAIMLERVALNLSDTTVPDNAGTVVSGQPVVPGGPIGYWTTLPIDRMKDAIEKHEIPVLISNHAGTYVCNHIFYRARHEIERLGIDAKCGLIHIPLLREQAIPERTDVPSLPKQVILTAIKKCLKVIEEEKYDPQSV